MQSRILALITATAIAAGCTTTQPEQAARREVRIVDPVIVQDATNAVAGGSYAQRGVSPADPLPGFDSRNTTAGQLVQPGRNLEPSHVDKQGRWRLWERLFGDPIGAQGTIAGVRWRTADTLFQVEHADAVHFHLHSETDATSGGLGGNAQEDSAGATARAGATANVDTTGTRVNSPTSQGGQAGTEDSSVATTQLLRDLVAELRARNTGDTVAPAPPAAGALPVDSSLADPTGALSDHVWAFGGFDGSAAVLDPDVVVSDFAVSESGCTYSVTPYAHWSDQDSEAVACLFVLQSDGTWRGGKFDWAPVGRTGRPWDNVRGGYNGWVEPASGSTIQFVLVSPEAQFHSNPVTGIWP